MLHLVGLEEKANSYPTELSGGEQQRVAIARALVNNPNTIIADEPTGNLDPERSLELMSLLVRINELGTTVVVVTHEKDLVDRFGKRVVTIDSGHVVNDSVGGYVGRAYPWLNGTIFGIFFHEGLSNMFSHGFMSFAAIGITVACLLIMGTFTPVAVNANALWQIWRRKTRSWPM